MGVQPGWTVLPFGRLCVVIYKMPTWGMFVTWRGTDGWARQIWPKEKIGDL